MGTNQRIAAIFKKNIKSDTKSYKTLINDLEDVKRELAVAYSNFNNTMEPELIEACIFEINSLQARYSFLIRKIKEDGNNGKVELFRFPRKEMVSNECS